MPVREKGMRRGILEPPAVVEPHVGVVLLPKGTIPAYSRSPSERKNVAFDQERSRSRSSGCGGVPERKGIIPLPEPAEPAPSFPKKHQIQPCHAGDNVSTRLVARLWNSTWPCPGMARVMGNKPRDSDVSTRLQGWKPSENWGKRARKSWARACAGFLSMGNAGRTWVLGMWEASRSHHLHPKVPSLAQIWWCLTKIQISEGCSQM